MEIMRNYVISNGVIEHEKKLNRSVLDKNEQVKSKIIFFHRYSEQIEC